MSNPRESVWKLREQFQQASGIASTGHSLPLIRRRELLRLQHRKITEMVRLTELYTKPKPPRPIWQSARGIRIVQSKLMPNLAISAPKKYTLPVEIRDKYEPKKANLMVPVREKKPQKRNKSKIKADSIPARNEDGTPPTEFMLPVFPPAQNSDTTLCMETPRQTPKQKPTEESKLFDVTLEAAQIIGKRTIIDQALAREQLKTAAKLPRFIDDQGWIDKELKTFESDFT
jgi:hypothetical protein